MKKHTYVFTPDMSQVRRLGKNAEQKLQLCIFKFKYELKL